MSVASGLATSSANTIQLAVEFAVLETLAESAITDGSIAVSANSDAIAAPNVKVGKVESFNGKLFVDFECSNATSAGISCKPSIVGTETQSQALSAMSARIIQVAGRASVDETLGQLTYSQLKSRFDAASGEVAASSIAGLKAKFNGLPHVTAVSGNRLVLVIAIKEAIGSTSGTGYKAFLLK